MGGKIIIKLKPVESVDFYKAKAVLCFNNHLFSINLSIKSIHFDMSSFLVCFEITVQ